MMNTSIQRLMIVMVFEEKIIMYISTLCILFFFFVAIIESIVTIQATVNWYLPNLQGSMARGA